MKYQKHHTKPGFSKANKSLTIPEYTTLLGLAAEARKMIAAKYDRLTVGRVRVFTEPRKGGLRTKLWGSGYIKPQQVRDIQDMLTKQFPQLNVEVHFNAEKQQRWYFDALSIYLRPKPATLAGSTFTAPVAEKPKARIFGSPLIMHSAVVDIATIPAGTLSVESQFHITINEDPAKGLEFELVDSWLVLNDKHLVVCEDRDKYDNFLELYLGRDIASIYKDAQTAAEEVVRKSVVLHGKKFPFIITKLNLPDNQ
jgi:hypothetical protein